MTDETGPKSSLVTAFDAYQETEEWRDILGYVKASKPSAILFMAFSAGWVARRDWHTKTYPQPRTEVLKKLHLLSNYARDAGKVAADETERQDWREHAKSIDEVIDAIRS